jgi:hypothetical protein
MPAIPIPKKYRGRFRRHDAPGRGPVTARCGGYAARSPAGSMNTKSSGGTKR